MFRDFCNIQSLSAADEMKTAYKASFKDGVMLLKEFMTEILPSLIQGYVHLGASPVLRIVYYF